MGSTPLKNMVVKIRESSPIFGMNIKHIWVATIPEYQPTVRVVASSPNVNWKDGFSWRWPAQKDPLKIYPKPVRNEGINIPSKYKNPRGWRFHPGFLGGRSNISKKPSFWKQVGNLFGCFPCQHRKKRRTEPARLQREGCIPKNHVEIKRRKSSPSIGLEQDHQSSTYFFCGWKTVLYHQKSPPRFWNVDPFSKGTTGHYITQTSCIIVREIILKLPSICIKLDSPPKLDSI